MAREVMGDEVAVPVDAFEPAVPEIPALFSLQDLRIISTQELPRERPVDAPNGMLEARAPIGAARVRAVLQPGIDQDPGAAGIALVRRQVPGLGQRDQLQVAVDLPEILDVADPRRIAVVDTQAELERRLDAGLGID